MARTCLFVLVMTAAVADVASATETVPDWVASPETGGFPGDSSSCSCEFHDSIPTRGCLNEMCNNCGRCSQAQYSNDGVNFYRYCSCTNDEQCGEQCPKYDPNAAKWHHPPCQLPTGTEVEIRCNIFSTMTDECRDDVCWCYFNADAGCPTSAVRVGGAIAVVLLLCACCVCGCRKFCNCCKSDQVDQVQAATAGVQDPLLGQAPTSTDPIGNRYGSFMQQAGEPPIVANGQQQLAVQQHVQHQQFTQQQQPQPQIKQQQQLMQPTRQQPGVHATPAAPSAPPAVNPAPGATSTLAEFCTSASLSCMLSCYAGGMQHCTSTPNISRASRALLAQVTTVHIFRAVRLCRRHAQARKVRARICRARGGST